MDGDDLLLYVEADELISIHKNYKKNVTKEAWDDFCSKNAHLVSICENLKEEDNPVLLRIKVKLK